MSAPIDSVRSGPEPPPGWDEFVRRTGTFCHLSAWARVFAEAFSHETRFAWLENEGTLEAGLPLVSMPDLPWGRALMSMPYLNYGGPVGSEDGREALARWALGEAEESGARRLVLRAMDPLDGPLGTGREKVTVLLPLPDDPEALWTDGFRSKLRSQIRRPMKEDMTVSFGPEQLDPFYRVFAENMRDLGTPVLPPRFFEAILRHLPDHVEFGVVYHDDIAVAGGCGFHFEGEFEITWASSLSRYNRLSPNMLLYWRFMEQAIERGCSIFNFGRCTPGGGTHRFKLQWGDAHDRPLHWLDWPNVDAHGPEEESKARIVAQRVWQRLPLPVANRIGPFLARRLTAF